MLANIQAALNTIILWEGNEVNRSLSEPGGISKYGISLTTYGDYCKKYNLPVPTADTIANLTEADARNFYSVAFLPAVRFNDLPSGIDVRLADISVNLGITGAINLLEMTLLQWPLNSVMSNGLIKSLHLYKPESIVMALATGWISNKHNHASWYQFGHGWSNRNIIITTDCLQLINKTEV